jgi:hypothetical protein
VLRQLLHILQLAFAAMLLCLLLLLLLLCLPTLPLLEDMPVGLYDACCNIPGYGFKLRGS